MKIKFQISDSKISNSKSIMDTGVESENFYDGYLRNNLIAYRFATRLLHILFRSMSDLNF